MSAGPATKITIKYDAAVGNPIPSTMEQAAANNKANNKYPSPKAVISWFSLTPKPVDEIAAITIPAATITTATQRPARITTIAAAATAALVLHGRARGSIPFPAAMSHVGVHSTALWTLPAETTAQPLSLLVAVPLLWLSADARITTASPPAAAAAADTETTW